MIKSQPIKLETIMTSKPTTGSVAAKQGYEYANNLIKYLNSYNTEKNNDKNLFKLCANILKEVGIDIKETKSVTAKKPQNHKSKPDLILCIEFLNGFKQEIGISIKKGSTNTISFNNQSLKTFLDHPTIDFNALYPLGIIGLSKWLGLEPYKTLWPTEYGHEIRPQGCYLLEELKQEEREDLVRLFTDKHFLQLVLNKIFISNNFIDTEKADIILYPRIPNSIKSNDFVICNTENLINKLLKDFEKDRNIIQNIDPHALPRPGIREKDDVPNTIQFYNGLFHMQRKSSGGKEQTNLLVQVNLKKLDSIQKTVRKLINQKIAGINQFKNQIDFREKLKEIYSQEDLDNHIIRSSPSNYELAKVNFSSFWIDNKSKFDLFETNERDFFDGINYMLGTPGYSPTDAFHNNKIEKISKNDLLNLKTLPYFYLKGSIKQEIRKFFDKNIRLFLEILIFNNNENKFIGIIYNTSRYKITQILNTKKLDKVKILDYAVARYREQTFTKKTKSLDLGICCIKKYGGGGVKATQKAKSALVLALKNKALDRIL